ncbi:MAG: insulinase family protein [Microscillaceae bacterium]|nr:insulinase family protein [Microscillaceae bacterium]MDW8460479.1 insulinase family protein [Cytophagales bacterium]
MFKRNAFLCLSIWVTFFIKAQDLSDVNKPLSLDPNVKIGKLPNGITYYVRKNAKPEKKVELRLVVNAGSILEDDDQLGLAHFMEHMCFNGTKNFPKNELVAFLQGLGIRFGADLNAYTSFDETVYILPVPLDKPENLDKGFQVLQDWAFNATLDNAEIDKERGVVIEEWRLGRGASQRMQDKWLPVMLKGSRYAERLPIGKKEILESFKYDVIKRFYKDWYRPDLMAVIAVGDVEPATLEAKIKQFFGNAPAITNPRKREVYGVPAKTQMQAVVTTDKEAPNVTVFLTYDIEDKPMTKIIDYKAKLTKDLFTSMFNARLDELRQKSTPPFIFAGSFVGNLFARNQNAYGLQGVLSEQNIELGLKTLFEEQQRLKKHGFIASELERAKKRIFTNMERAFKEKDKTESEQYVSEYVSHFLENEPAPGIEMEFAMTQKFLPEITLDEVNALVKQWINDNKATIVLMAPEKEGLQVPTEEQIKKMAIEIANQNIEPYQEKAVAASLLNELPKVGKITKEEKNAKLGTTTLTFANGATVVLKPTDFKNDQILFSSYSWGGHSLYADSDYHSVSYAAGIVNESGVEGFPKPDLQKFLAGKTVNINSYISELSEGFSGNTRPEDLETFLQLLYLYFTKPLKNEEAFKSLINRQKAQFKNILANPQIYFISEANKIIYNNNIRRKAFPQDEDFEKINLDKALQFYKERFANAAEFKFIFVGSFEVEKIKPLLEQYIGSLPAQPNAPKEKFKNLKIKPVAGVLEKEIYKGTDEKSVVRMTYFGDLKKYEGTENFALRSVAEWLNIKLIELLREEKGGVYGVGASANMNKNPEPTYELTINFPCAPQNVADLSKSALSLVEKLKKEGVAPADLAKIKEQYKKELDVNLKENRYWLNSLQRYDQLGENPEKILEAQANIDKLTGKMIQDAAKKYLTGKNFIKLVLLPEKK